MEGPALTSGRRPQDAATPGAHGTAWQLALGLGLPLLLVVLAGLAVPASTAHFCGIPLASWCLFACAPLTSLCLAICWRQSGETAATHTERN